MSPLQEELANSVQLKQFIILKKLNLEDNETTKVFPNKSNLKLSYFGYKLANDIGIEFSTLRFTEELTINEIKSLCELSKSIFYIDLSYKHLYTTDLTFVSLYNIFQGNKKALF